jgi:hypothetical protein
MTKRLLVLVLFLALPFGVLGQVPTPSSTPDQATLITQRWIDKHQRTLTPTVQDYFKRFNLKWAQVEHDLNKNEPLWATVFIDLNHYSSDHPNSDSTYELPLLKLDPGKAKDHGIPSTIEKQKIKSFYRYGSEGRSLLFACYAPAEPQNGDEDEGLESRNYVYLETKNGPKELAFGAGIPDGFHLWNLGKGSPNFIAMDDFGGGSGSSLAFSILDGDKAKKLLTFGFWNQSFLALLDLDGDGRSEIVHQTRTFAPKDLENSLNACDCWDNVTPFLFEVEIYKWTGTEFKNLGKEYRILD